MHVLRRQKEKKERTPRRAFHPVLNESCLHCKIMSSSSCSELDSDCFVDFDDEERDWAALLGDEHAVDLTEWLADQCPHYVALHECQLDKGVWENCTRGKPQAEKAKAFDAVCTESMGALYAAFETAFGGSPLPERLRAVELRDGETEAMDVLEDFWADHQEPWMCVANGDARRMLKGRVGMEVLVMADVHRQIAMSGANMTEFASAILAVDRPCPYAVERALKKHRGRPEDDAMAWNYPAANDVLRRLVAAHFR
jgi:hypothetical protein